MRQNTLISLKATRPSGTTKPPTETTATPFTSDRCLCVDLHIVLDVPVDASHPQILRKAQAGM